MTGRGEAVLGHGRAGRCAGARMGSARIGAAAMTAAETPPAPARKATPVVLPPLPEEAADPRFRAIYDYWTSRAPPGLLPGRQHIDPLDTPALLPGIVLYDVVPWPPGDVAATGTGAAGAGGTAGAAMPGDAGLRFRMRIAGEMLVEVLGRNPTGRFIDEFVLDERKADVNAAFAAVAQGRIADYWENQLWTAGREYVRMQRLALPLARDGVTPDMVIAYYVRTNLPQPV